MNQTEFWHHIDAAQQEAAGDTEKQEAVLLEMLAQYTPAGIIDFERLLRQYILQADDFRIIAA